MLDQQLAAAKQHNSEVLLVLGLTPTWASSRPGENSNYGLGAIAPPANIEDWRNYVRTVGLRYKGQISAYEIWNEVNLSYYFSGTVSDMLMLAQEAYIILKQIDPAAVVTSPSAMGGGYVWLDQFLTAGGSAYCDVIAFHFYNFPAIPESMTWLINKVQSVMSNHGILNKPLWNTEIGWGYPQTFSSEEEMASYIARTVLINWSYHVSRIYWYAWDNHGWASLWLTEQDNTTLTKAGVAWNTVHSWLLGTQLNSCQYISDSVIGCNLNTSSGPAHIIWAPQGTIQFTAPSNWSIETIGTLDGNIQPFPAGPITVTRDPIFLK